MRQQDTDDVEEQVEGVVLKGFLGGRGWVYTGLCQMVDLSESLYLLAVFLLDLFDHESA